MKKRYFHDFVDEIMKDGKVRSPPAIIDILNVTMCTKDNNGRNRVGFYIPCQRGLSYYLKVNNLYNIVSNARIKTWKMDVTA